MRTVYLKDQIEAVKEECVRRNEPSHDYSIQLIDKAIQAQVAHRLRYTNGKTSDRDGVVSQYVYSTDAPNYESDEDCAKWELSGHVRNSASRLHRGLTAI